MKLSLFATLLVVVNSRVTNVQVTATFKCSVSQTFKLMVRVAEHDRFLLDKMINTTTWMNFTSGSSVTLKGVDDADPGKEFEFYVQYWHICNKERADDWRRLDWPEEQKRQCHVNDPACTYRVNFDLPRK